MFKRSRLTYPCAMRTRTAVWETLAIDGGRLVALAAGLDRALRLEEFVLSCATTERRLGEKLPDRSPERRN